jgi:beta-phosphoglucomutase-like phosphatase (HAD superfamily)
MIQWHPFIVVVEDKSLGVAAGRSGNLEWFGRKERKDRRDGKKPGNS